MSSPRNLPLLRSECEDGPRPCPFISCRHHLGIAVSRTGALKFFHVLDGGPDPRDPKSTDDDVLAWLVGMPETCALDVADNGEHWQEEVAVAMGATRQRIQQIEEAAFTVMRKRARHLR